MTDPDVVIKIEHATKVYRIFERPLDRLKESLSPFHKRYSRDFFALDDLSLEIRRGETIGIIGRNGAGKSTLLKLITGVLQPTQGKIAVQGKMAALLELGAGFNPEMTGLENVYLSGLIMGFSREEMDGKMDTILRFADIGDFIYQPVKMYSSGMFARLAFSVNVAVEPDVLIVDEALSVGDVFFQNKCFRKFEEIQRRGTNILFVSHDINAVKRFCNKVLWLDQGHEVMFGDRDQVCAAYLSEQLKSMNKENRAGVEDLNGANIDCWQAEAGTARYPAIVPREDTINNFPERSKIVSFFITDMDGNMTTNLCTRVAYEIHIVGRFFEDIHDVIFGITLDNAQGIQVLAMNTFLSTRQGVSVRAGTVVESRMRFTLPMLHEGEYLISPAMSMGTQQSHVNLTWLPLYAKILVSNAGANISLLELDTESAFSVFDEQQVEFY